MNLVDRLLGIMAEKDENSVILKCNTIFLKYAGYRSEDEVIGCTDEDLPWQEYASVYRRHELDALAGDNYSILYNIKDAEGVVRLFLHTKVQRSDENHNVIGTAAHAVEVMQPNVHKLSHLLSERLPTKPHYTLNKRNFSVKLSRRQEEVLFCLLGGRSPKYIAQVLNVNVRTVYSYIDQIKVKFNCFTKSELIDRATELGFANNIPIFKSVDGMLDVLSD